MSENEQRPPEDESEDQASTPEESTPPAQYPPAQQPVPQYPPAQYPPAQQPAQPPPAQYPPAGYPAPPPGYPPSTFQPPGYRPYAASPPNNGFAIAALVCGIAGFGPLPIIGSILGIVFGSMAKKQIAASQGREGGESMANAGVILGWVGLALMLLVLGVMAVLFIGLFAIADEVGEILPSITPLE